jgi:DNA-binding MarR family transcriptional regulator
MHIMVCSKCGNRNISTLTVSPLQYSILSKFLYEDANNPNLGASWNRGVPINYISQHVSRDRITVHQSLQSLMKMGLVQSYKRAPKSRAKRYYFATSKAMEMFGIAWAKELNSNSHSHHPRYNYSSVSSDRYHIK